MLYKISDLKKYHLNKQNLSWIAIGVGGEINASYMKRELIVLLGLGGIAQE